MSPGGMGHGKKDQNARCWYASHAVKGALQKAGYIASQTKKLYFEEKGRCLSEYIQRAPEEVSWKKKRGGSGWGNLQPSGRKKGNDIGKIVRTR